MFDFKKISVVSLRKTRHAYTVCTQVSKTQTSFVCICFYSITRSKALSIFVNKSSNCISYKDTLTILKYWEDMVMKEECSTVQLINTAVTHSSIDNIDDEMESIFYTFQTQIYSNQKFLPNKLQQIQLMSKRIIPGQLKNCLKFPSRNETDPHSCQDVLIVNQLIR